MDRTMGRRTLGVVGIAAAAAAGIGIWSATSASADSGTAGRTSVSTSTSASPVALPPEMPTPGESCDQQLAAAALRAKYHLPTIVQKQCE